MHLKEAQCVEKFTKQKLLSSRTWGKNFKIHHLWKLFKKRESHLKFCINQTVHWHSTGRRLFLGRRRKVLQNNQAGKSGTTEGAENLCASCWYRSSTAQLQSGDGVKIMWSWGFELFFATHFGIIHLQAPAKFNTVFCEAMPKCFITVRTVGGEFQQCVIRSQEPDVRFGSDEQHCSTSVKVVIFGKNLYTLPQQKS